MNYDFIDITAAILIIVSAAQLVWGRTLIKVVRAGFVLMATLSALWFLR